jgi:hypothetical protein
MQTHANRESSFTWLQSPIGAWGSGKETNTSTTATTKPDNPIDTPIFK